MVFITVRSSYPSIIYSDSHSPNKGKIEADKIILATGGKSYPLTGSTGDGYKLAKKVGHTITTIKPALVPLEVYEYNTCKIMQGLTLKKP